VRPALLSLSVLLPLAALISCASQSPPPLHADLTDAQIRAETASRFPLGSSPQDVERTLDRLGMPYVGNYQMLFEHSANQIVARVKEPSHVSPRFVTSEVVLTFHFHSGHHLTDIGQDRQLTGL
jgi:hypothetical protein